MAIVKNEKELNDEELTQLAERYNILNIKKAKTKHEIKKYQT